MPLIAAVIIFLAIFSLVLALGGSRPVARTRLEAIVRRGVVGSAAPQPVARPAPPILQGISEQLTHAMPANMLNKSRQRLVVAGEPMTLEAFVTLRAVCLALFGGLPLLLFMTGGLRPNLLGAMVGGGALVLGLLLPQMWLSQRVRQRQTVIIKSLPDAFDLITTCVEAGLGLDAALGRVAQKVEGPFADELTRALRDIGLGKSRREALFELGQRTGVPDLVTFVNAVVQAEQMGSSIGNVLRVQSAQLRVRRKQRAEQEAYKAPVKMIFPLVLCIFPSLFIVILGPAIISIMHGFPK